MLKVKILTPSQVILEGDAIEDVQVTSHCGDIGIYPGHAALVTLLSEGILSYTQQNSSQNMAISWGYLEVYEDNVSILVDRVAHPSEVSRSQCQKKLEELEAEMEGAPAAKLPELQKEMAWQQAKLNLIS